MSDKRSGYEKAAESQPASGSPAKQGDPIVLKVVKKHKVRKRDIDLLAMNRIDAILEKFSPNSAMRILGYCTDKQKERFIAGVPEDPQRPARLVGGSLYTPPFKEFSQMDD